MALTDKVLMFGVDGLDPSLTRKFVDEGKLPNIKKFIDAGAQKKELKLLCTPPTITPPLWTTLSTGALPVPMGSPASGVRILYIWILLVTTLIAVSVMQKHCGMSPLKQGSRRSYGIGLATPGLQPQTAQICMWSMAPSQLRQTLVWQRSKWKR